MKIAVYGLGHVGLPVALNFSQKGYEVIGVDTDKSKIEKLNRGEVDVDNSYLRKNLKNMIAKKRFKATGDGEQASNIADVMIIGVPTPVTEDKKPYIGHVMDAGRNISKGLFKGNLVVLESTVYPGCTENDLKKVLEESGLRAGKDFGLSYVPHRYNPGEKNHTVDKVARIVGSINNYWLKKTVGLYREVCEDIFEVGDIKTAEATKLLENIQRDTNIALINEVSMILDKVGIDIHEVLDAASTKWNFVKYLPGIGVGGHCLPVDPYYLTYIGDSKMISSAREVNDHMPYYITGRIKEKLKEFGKDIYGSKIIVLGLAYKGNVGDQRNSPSLKMISELRRAGAKVIVCDPYSNNTDASFDKCDCIIIGSEHEEFRKLDFEEIRKKSNNNCLIVDRKNTFNRKNLKSMGFSVI